MGEVSGVAVMSIPEVNLSSAASRPMPKIGFGTAVTSLDGNGAKAAVLEAIKLGYRHFDTASLYGSEKPLGEAIAEAIQLGLIGSREELFLTSKLWCSDAHSHLVVPALKKTLRNLEVEYLDLYLIHFPISAKPGLKHEYPIPEDDLLSMDFKSVWASMEQCQTLNLTKAIGVSNFSIKKLENILTFATIPPSVNQVEMNPTWQQKKLREFCRINDIVVTAYSPLGASASFWGGNNVMGNEILKEIAQAHGKTLAQVCLRWMYEQGPAFLVKSYNPKRMEENLKIFDWELTDEDIHKIDHIPQKKTLIECFISPNGPYKTPEEFWDGEM